MKENFSQNNISLNLIYGAKTKPNRHVSVLYGQQYLKKQPTLKKCRKTEYDCFANINKKQIFTLVFHFVKKLLESQEFLEKILEDTKFDKNQLEHIITQTAPLQTKQALQQNKLLKRVSINETNDELMDNKKSLNSQVKKAKSCKKLSIMLEGNFDEFEKISQGSNFFSEESISAISALNITDQEFTQNMVEMIYQQPEPFLINLSVCLMLKFLSCSKTTLNPKNICWILSIGTIVAYKIYYDEPVQGLVDSFAYILKIDREDIIKLQRHFLNEIDHEAVISNEQYHCTLYQIIKEGNEFSQNCDQIFE